MTNKQATPEETKAAVGPSELNVWLERFAQELTDAVCDNPNWQDINDLLIAALKDAIKTERTRCKDACIGELLAEHTDSEGDIAYQHAVTDCIAAIDAL